MLREACLVNQSAYHRDAASIMIIASVNGTRGQGFLESVEHDDGSVRRIGVMKISALDAKRLQQLVDEHQPLLYSGPVLAKGRWRAETVPIVAMSFVTDPGVPTMSCVTLCEPAPQSVA